jgi:tetratricopeptide (TPR) repeat protein
MSPELPAGQADTGKLPPPPLPHPETTRAAPTGRARRWRRLPFWLLLTAGLGLLLFLVGRHLWARYHVRAAEEALQRYAFAEALDHLDHALEVWPDSLPTRLLAARTARRAGRLDLAREQLAQCRRLDSSPEVQLEERLFRCQRGELDLLGEADLWAAVQGGHPQGDLILEALTVGALSTYRLDRAGRWADLLLERVPGHVEAHVWRGLAQEGMFHLPEALKDYRRAVELNPAHETARLRLAEGLLFRGEFQEALEHLETLRTQGPASAAVLLDLARCRRLLGEPERARELLDEAVAFQAPPAAVYRERGSLALDMGNLADAERWLRQAHAVDAHDTLTCYKLAEVLAQTGRKAEGEEYLAKSRRIDTDAHRLEEIVHALGSRPGDAGLRCEAGEICLRNGQEAEALRWLQGALQANPQHPATHRVLADYYERRGQPELAREHRSLAGPLPH